MQLTDTDFQLFGVPQRFAQDRAVLDARWRELQSEVHPDRFSAEGPRRNALRCNGRCA